VKVLVLGCGLVGTQVARTLRADGHHVTGTTTTPEKREPLLDSCDEVLLLRTDDRGAVHTAVEAADGVAVCVGPDARRSMTPEDRAAHYREVLVDTAETVTTAPGSAHLVALSSLAVYGTAADHLREVTEDAPLTDADDPSPASFRAMEDTYLRTDRACVFRCPDLHGADDPPIAVKVEMAHQLLGGSVPFSAEALSYRLHVDEAARAVAVALTRGLVGVFNLVGDELPPTNAGRFDAVAEAQGHPPLTYRGEIASPAARVSNRKLTAGGVHPGGEPVTTYELTKWAHVLLFGVWLGADYGTFLSSRFLLRSDRSLETRATAARMMVLFDLGPRLALVLMLPLGLTLASAMGFATLPAGTVPLTWALALGWLGVVAAVELGEHRSWREPLRRIDLGIRIVVAATLLATGLVSLIGDGPFAGAWLAWKVTLFGAIVSSGLAIRLGLRRFTPAFTRVMQEGSTPANELALRRSLAATYPFVGAIWLMVLGSGLLGVVKP
jgi:nucleoside-diphosphate-sugar epimerase